MSIFLKLGRIVGSSTDPVHMQWIELSSCNFPSQPRTPAAPARPAPGPRLKPQIELQCSKRFDVSSGALLRMATDGSVVDTATLEFLRDDGVPGLRLSLSAIALTSFSTKQDAPNSVVESFRLICVLEDSYRNDTAPPPRTNDPPVFDLWGADIKIAGYR